MRLECVRNNDCLKWCPKCESILEYSNFRKNKNRKDGLNGWCKRCCTNYQKIERERGLVQRELRYRNSIKGKKTLQKATEKYRKTEKYKISWKKTNKKNKLSNSISARMRQSLHGCKYNRHWESLVNYTLEDLKSHLEKQFKPGMNWKNHGRDGWHIDHIKPIDLFNITDYRCDDFTECWSLGNLQPLWAKDNMKKGNKYEI